jgi:hypothetical protein
MWNTGTGITHILRRMADKKENKFIMGEMGDEPNLLKITSLNRTK